VETKKPLHPRRTKGTEPKKLKKPIGKGQWREKGKCGIRNEEVLLGQKGEGLRPGEESGGGGGVKAPEKGRRRRRLQYSTDEETGRKPWKEEEQHEKGVSWVGH